MNEAQRWHGQGVGRAEEADEWEEIAEEPVVSPGAFNTYELCPQDPSRMELTDQERQWALAIKAAIQQSPEIDNLSDFEYAQYALVDQDDVTKAVQRAEHFQSFRQEYGLADTCEQAKHSVRASVQLQPNLLLSLCHNQEQGNYVIVLDNARFYDSSIKTDDDFRITLEFVYFGGHFLSPDFTAIRQGAIFCLECEGYDWKKNSMEKRRQMWTQVLANYPLNMHKIKYFHTGLCANLAISMMKRFLPFEMYSRIEVGCIFPGRLDTFYAIPTLEIANQRLIQRMDACLERRYENIRNFKLER